jgi:signal transduction histidine kinase/CheY-like chemotaxis protein
MLQSPIPRWPFLLAVVFGVYSVAMLWNTFHSRDLLHRAAEARLVASAQRRATTVAEFVAARRQDVVDLAEGHEIEAFLANRALGMSMRYGLATNLDAIEQAFRRRLVKKAAQSPLFDRIAYVDETGAALVDTAPDTPLRAIDPSAARRGVVLIDPDLRQWSIVVPVSFRESPGGHVIAIGNVADLSQHLIDTADGGKYREVLVDATGRTLGSTAERAAAGRDVARLIAGMPENDVVHLRDTSVRGFDDSVALRTSIAGTPVSLVPIVATDVVFGDGPSAWFVQIAAVGLPAIILLAGFMIDRARRRSAALQEKVFASAQRTVELAGRNNELAGEISRRRAIENELREKSELLEEKSVALRETALRAEEANRAKSNFLATMSHEIRTPMNAIIGMTELVLDSELEAQQREYLGIVRSSACNLLTIINDILDFSKIEAGRLELERIPFDLHALVGEIVKPLGPAAAEKGLELLTETSPGVPRWLVGDPVRLRQILLNLLNNAIKFTQQGHVLLRIERGVSQPAQPIVRFAVIDTGIGIPPDKQGAIFEAFSQQDSSTTRRFGGTGLGLTISARLAHLMGGRIGVESEVGKGSAFHVALRFGLAQPPDAEAPVRLDGKRVLVIESNAVARRILFETLRNRGAEVVLASDASQVPGPVGAEAAPPAFDVALVEQCVPGAEGGEVARALRRVPAYARLPIVMLSSIGQHGSTDPYPELGIAVHLTKPVTQQELLAAVASVLAPAVASPARPGNAPAAKTATDEGGLVVLVVEDNAVNQKLVKTLLERAGHRVLIAENGEEAIRTWSAQHVDLVLMDMQMPVMGGFEATYRIRALERRKPEPCHTPIYALSASAMADERAAGIAAGMDGYLTKPLVKAELAQVLEQVCEKRGMAPPLASKAQASEPAAQV